MNRESAPELSIVVPCLNEKENLIVLEEAVKDALKAEQIAWEIIFVDDGSTDGTIDTLRRLDTELPNIRYVSFSRNFGQQAAITAGLERARGGAVVVMDADLQHPPDRIPEMLGLWKQGYDIVNMLRQDGTTPSLKQSTSQAFYRIFRALSKIEIRPGSSDFRLLDRRVVEQLRQLPKAGRFYRGLIPWAGFKQAHVAYEPSPRRQGETKYSLRRMARLGLDGILAFSEYPLMLAAVLDVACAALLFTGAVVAAAARLSGVRLRVGPAALLVGAFLLGSLMFSSIAVAALYIAEIKRRLERRPPYIVRETDSKSRAVVEDPIGQRL